MTPIATAVDSRVVWPRLVADGAPRRALTTDILLHDRPEGRQSLTVDAAERDRSCQASERFRTAPAATMAAVTHAAMRASPVQGERAWGCGRLVEKLWPAPVGRYAAMWSPQLGKTSSKRIGRTRMT